LTLPRSVLFRPSKTRCLEHNSALVTLSTNPLEKPPQPRVFCITEHIPVAERLKIKALEGAGVRVAQDLGVIGRLAAEAFG